MKNFIFPIIALSFVALVFFPSCKDKKTADKKTPIEVQKETPKTIVAQPIKEEPQQVTPPAVRKIIVKKGEWLYNISRREYGNAQGWIKIFNANKAIIDNPDLIFPNQEFIIPE